MFNKDFFPTPANIITEMVNGYEIENKTILEPSAGKGDIVDHLINQSANVIACEINEDLRKIVSSKCKVIAADFLSLTSEQVSHIDMIVMNPPFSADEKHILHAWAIAPAGCQILALCNLATVENQRTTERQQLGQIIEDFGTYIDMGECFDQAERKTNVEVALVKIKKPGENYNQEFEGFFLDEDPAEQQANSIIPFNGIRDLVNRYVEAVKLFDRQLETGVKMGNLIDDFYHEKLAFSCTEKGQPKLRTDFKKDLQKAGWKHIFNIMDMGRIATKGLREDINKFVEKQEAIPFTMRNIYRMLEIVIGTTEQRMDKALLEVFNKLTEHYHENRFNVPGWKTNSHYLVNQRFIFPHGAELGWTKDYVKIKWWNHYGEMLIDVEKALCFLTGENYENIRGIQNLPDKMNPGQWYDTHFFTVRGYKKGTIHCEFRDADLWGRFNQRIAKIKGYPLYESVKTKETEKRNTETAKRYKPTVLATIKIN